MRGETEATDAAKDRQVAAASRRCFLSYAAAAATAVGSGLRVWAELPILKRVPIIGFTKPFQQLSFEETADTVAEIGWDGIECPVRPKGQVEPERAADDLPRLVEALRARGKELMLLATAITRADQPYAESLLRTAAKLGIPRYRLGFIKYDLSRPIAEQVRETRAQMRDLAALNADIGIQGGYQNHSGRDYVGAPVWDVWSMIQDLDPRHLGVCFDIGHATIEGGRSWPIDARLMLPHLAAVFVKDFVWRKTPQGWREEWVLLGEGMVDRAYFRWLRESSYSGPISQHHEYDHGQGASMIAKLQQDLRVLRNWLVE
ncbi:MAG: sugar phosphate isomerase/epimerase family protein [Pirellulaceae bacterium]